jgi:hypothetical protein
VASVEGRRGSFNNPVDAAIFDAAQLVFAGAHDEAARMIDGAVTAAPPGNAGWLIPLEPLLNVSAAAPAWAPVLARLRTRAS